MEKSSHRAIAIVGTGAILPDAQNVPEFWENVKNGKYSISDVTPDRWDSAAYYDPDPSAPDKTYSKIGGWVRSYPWDPMKWRLPIPPRVADAMDISQKWAIACTREALEDYGYPNRPLDPDRTAVILGNAMGGEKHYLTVLRISFPEYAEELSETASFAALPESLRREILRDLRKRVSSHMPEITEDTMPGELSNCIAGRIANIFNFHGPNFVCDAACASAMAAINSAVEGLIQNDYDFAVTGGIDRNMGASTFVKFCKIGALSATGTRPYAEGADGFVMGEGAAIFLLKRLADAERDGDKIYAVLRGMGGSSDGKGKGITAPNPIGQRLAIERAWQNAGLSPASVTYIEGHGTSTRVGDVVEVQSMVDVLGSFNLTRNSVAIGSVKSNLGHLKAAAGAAGFLKATLALRDRILPPSVHCQHPNPDIDFAHSPLYVNTELKTWDVPSDCVRRAGLSAFGFGGTNFHAVLEEYVPHKLNGNGKKSVMVNAPKTEPPIFDRPEIAGAETPALKSPMRGALLIGAETTSTLVERLRVLEKDLKAGDSTAPAPPSESDLRANERLAIDYGDARELAEKVTSALKAFTADNPALWKALRAQGIFRGTGPAGKVAFLYPGQGSQYVNMLKQLRDVEPLVGETFAEADRVMTPLLGKPLTEFIFIDSSDSDAVAKAEDDLRQTAITQPAVLATDLALTRLLASYGIKPDFAMGHSLGEYGALVAVDALPFADALEAVSARGREMTQVSMADNGRMAAVFAPLDEIERILKTINGYVVIANINSNHQAVIGGASQAVEEAMNGFQKAGYEVAPLSVSHAFHTSIVAPASEPLRRVLARLHLQSPRLPVVANTNGEFYPSGENVVPQMLDILAHQVAAPVQFVRGLRTLYEAGARVFVEVGPKRALQGFVEDVLGGHGDVASMFCNHPRFGDIVSFNQALCGLYAAGLGAPTANAVDASPVETTAPLAEVVANVPLASYPIESSSTSLNTLADDSRYEKLGHIFADVIERGWEIYHGKNGVSNQLPVAITGAALGLPGTEHIFDDSNIERILRGDQFIDSIPPRLRQAMVDKNVTRLVKSDNGGPTFETITDVADVLKLAGRGGALDMEREFGISSERLAALDRVTQLAIAVGLDALRDAGIPLVLRYKTTTKGTKLPDRWVLPDDLRDDTGVIFASAFPGYNSFADEMSRYHEDRARREQLAALESLRAQIRDANGDSMLARQIDQRIGALHAAIEKEPYIFNRRYLFRVLSMGHSQFAEFIGARGPNTAINSACATTTQAVALAEDWIRCGRCRRVVVVAADDVTTDHMLDWIGAGFLASGAAATDEAVEDAAIPFDRRRHGLIIGMGAAGLVIESAEAARERGIRPICEVLSSVTANSAFHGTRLDVQHINQVMEELVAKAERTSKIQRREIASRTVFVSHETYTPARGGSAAAEINALRHVFGNSADQIVIANTKGFTGHAMAAGIEDVLAVKALETGIVPPVPNFKEVDPALGTLNLSKGGSYPVDYALRLGAGFGSQISMTLMRWSRSNDGARRSPTELGYDYRINDKTAWNQWLSRISGYSAAELEVVARTLRVRDQGAAIPLERPETRIKASPVPPVLEKSKVFVATAIANSEPIAVNTKIEAETSVIAAVPSQSSAPITPEPKFEPVATPSAPAPVTEGRTDSVEERIIELAVEKTGYPRDMLDLDLDLEADLGVDTVKQAEMFAAIREIYDIPRDENRKLRDYPTLAHVIRFVYEKRPDLLNAASARVPQTKDESFEQKTAIRDAKDEARAGAASVAIPEAHTDDVRERILLLMVEKTGYPRDMLDLDLDLEADLGVDTVKQAEMFAAIREMYNIPRDENRKLRDYPTLAHVIRFVYEKRPDLINAASDSVPQTKDKSVEQKAAIRDAKEESLLAASPAVIPESDGVDVKERILELMVEKTGYPKDMLDLDLDLEADLGVDTVKQAEMFAAIRELYNIPRDENRKLRDYPTLAHVIRFVYEKRPDLKAATSDEAPASQPKQVAGEQKAAFQYAQQEAPVAAAIAAMPESDGVDVKERILELMVEKTGYPKDMLDLDLDLEADLGVDTVKQAEMFAAIRELYNIPRDENRKLRDYPTLAHVIRFVYEKRPDLATGVQPLVTAGEEVSTLMVVPVDVSITDDSIKDKVLEIVAEKTGYPVDMLDPDLDLEADLGIDTVKQAEMFAAIRSAYNIPRDENLKLRDFPTLAHVIKFAIDRSGFGDKSSKEHAPSEHPIESSQSVIGQGPYENRKPILASFDATNSIPRRVPLPLLRPPLIACKRTGVELDNKRVVLMPDRGGVAEELSGLLRSMNVEVLRIEGEPDAASLIDQLKTWLARGPIDGVYWLPALDNEGPLGEMTQSTWQSAVWVRIKLMYTTMRALFDQVARPGTFLVSGTRLGGQHGYDEAGAVAPLGGAVVGFTKTYKRERMDIHAKAVDFEAQRKPSEIAQILIEETLHDPGAVEIGYKDGLRWTIGLEEQPAIDGHPGLALSKDTVFVITGAAGSIVSAITADLAAASGGKFYLLDLVPEPDPKNPDLERFATDKEGLKRELFARIQARGERATPALVEKEIAKLERARAAQSAIDAVRAAGGRPHYFSVNLADAVSVAAVIQQVRESQGRIDVLLHAAGLDRSRSLSEKEPSEFDLVFDVKSDGFFNLLHSIGDMPLGATVAFSSIAGRFGNPGQTDYSSANDLLCKITSSLRTTRPATRGIVIDWTAWGGIGMATRGSIPKVMEMAGIDMLPPEAGVPLIRRELTAGSTRGEIVIGQRLGVLLNEWDETGGLDSTISVSSLADVSAPGPMIGRIARAGLYGPMRFETTLDPRLQPFLFDHQIDGTPVLPGVMGIEAFAEASLCFLPDWQIESIEAVDFHAPFKFYRNDPRVLTIEAVVHPNGGGVVADCRVLGIRQLPNNHEPQVTTHFTGRIRLRNKSGSVSLDRSPILPGGRVIEAADIYRLYFHGPAYQVLERAWWDGNRIIGLMAKSLPNNHYPPERPTVIAPRLIELCFQAAGVWEMGVQGRMGLPHHIDRISFIRSTELAEGRLYAMVTPDPTQGSFDAEVIDSQGHRYIELSGYRTVEFPNAVDAERLKELRAAMTLGAVAAL